MSVEEKPSGKKASLLSDVLDKSCKVMGRKRDPAIDSNILEAAIDTLSAIGFDNMTMDMVALKANSAKTTVYRRWPSKVELVRDALIWMGQTSINLGTLPDKGSLREDLLSLHKPKSAEHSERKMQVLARLGSFYTENETVAAEVKAAIFGPWVEMNKSLMERAIKRGEIPAHADIDMVGQIIIAMVSSRTAGDCKPFDKAHYARLIDNVLLPALRAPKE